MEDSMGDVVYDSKLHARSGGICCQNRTLRQPVESWGFHYADQYVIW
jgi:hypothetical protein